MAISVAYLASTSYSATDARRALVAPMAHNNASGFVVRSGVVPGVASAMQIASAGSLFVSIAPGQAIVDGQYTVTSDASVNVTVAPGGAATRWDAVVLRVQESALGDAANSVSFQVVQGSTTAIPTLPARSLLLGTVVVGAGVTSVNSGNIVDRRSFTTSAGGVLQTTAIPTTSDIIDGGIAYNLANSTHYVRKGSSIVQLLPVKYGRVDRTIEGNGFLRITSAECFFDGSAPAAIVAMGINEQFNPKWGGQTDGGGALLRVYKANDTLYSPGDAVALFFSAFK